jgi:hypothetical protein
MLVPAFKKNPFKRQRGNSTFNHQQRHTQIKERRNRHVSRNAAKRIEKQNLAGPGTLFKQRQTHRMRVRPLARTMEMRMRMRMRVVVRVLMRMVVRVIVRVLMRMSVVVSVVVLMRVIVVVIVSVMHGQLLAFR